MAATNGAKLLFLSHITQERKLAAIIKAALEEEFGGFVEVFVSSDEISIPAGSNFLKRIENALIDCIGAVYLIGPKSVRRPWINFELGAVWIRSAISQRAGNAEIPALPFCHSGMQHSDLPQPISNLNAVLANEPSQLRFAFTSIQTAVGGRGALRTNFDALAEAIKQFEIEYTVLDKLKEFFLLIEYSASAAKNTCMENKKIGTINFGQIHLKERQYDRLVELSQKDLKGIITVEFRGFSTVVGDDGARSGPEAAITCEAEYVRQLDLN